jgi:transposase
MQASMQPSSFPASTDPCPGDVIPPEHPARFIRDFVASLNLMALGFVFRIHPNRRRPHPAAVLLCVFLYGWYERIRSYRALETACDWDARFVFLTDGDAPSRSTLGRFWIDNHTCIVAVFAQLVRYAVASGLVGWDLHAGDGTKMVAACSMHSALHREGLKKSSQRWAWPKRS